EQKNAKSEQLRSVAFLLRALYNAIQLSMEYKRMPSLNKSTLALTFKFDCDRFLRFRLASKAEKTAIDLKEDTYYRTGIDLIKDAGRRWEADKYQDLIDAAGTGNVEYRLGVEDPDIGRRKFEKVENIFDILRKSHPPTAIVEGEFLVPTSITPALQEAY